jgi:hypothetical protein
MKHCLLISLVITGALGSVAQTGKSSTAPTRTACIKLLTGSEKDVASAQAEIKRSARFKFAQDCTKADLTVWLSTGSPAADKLCRATVQAIGADQKILWTETRTCKGNTAPVVAQLTHRMLLDLGAPRKNAKAAHR